MIEEDIQKLTAAVTQLTVTAEALLETLRSRDAAKQEAADDAVLKDAAEKLRAKAKAEAETEPKPKKAKAPKAEEPKPEPAPEAPAAQPEQIGVTLEQLRAEAQKALDSGKAKEIVAINREFGLKRISDAGVDQYPAILARLEEINGQA